MSQYPNFPRNLYIRVKVLYYCPKKGPSYEKELYENVYLEDVIDPDKDDA